MKLTFDTKLLEIEIKMLSTWTQGQLAPTGTLTAVNPWVKSEIIHLFINLLGSVRCAFEI